MKKSYQMILKQQRKRTALLLAQIGLVSCVVVLCIYYTELFDISRLAQGIPSIFILFAEGFPPNFDAAASWIKPLFDSIAMSIAGTTLALVLCVPLAILAAPNTAPFSIARHCARGLLNVFRSIPELIMGIIFVAAVGFGVLPGVLALGLHSIGMMGKFIAEAIEHSNKAPAEAALSVGASKLQVIMHGILPQVLPQIADTTIYRWEYNFRASLVMGMVGAGGIGLELMSSLRLMRYDEVSALLLILLAMVSLVDGIGILLRKRFQ